jgi:hypothetical protein
VTAGFRQQLLQDRERAPARRQFVEDTLVSVILAMLISVFAVEYETESASACSSTLPAPASPRAPSTVAKVLQRSAVDVDASVFAFLGTQHAALDRRAQ